MVPVDGHPSVPSQSIKIELREMGAIHCNCEGQSSKTRVPNKDVFSSPKPSGGVSKRINCKDCSIVNTAYSF